MVPRCHPWSHGLVRTAMLAALAAVAMLGTLLVPGSQAHVAKKKKQRPVPAAFFGMLRTPASPYVTPPSALDAGFAQLQKAHVGFTRPSFNAGSDDAALDPYVLAAARHHVRLIPMLIDGRGYSAAPGKNHGFRPPNASAYAAWAGSLAKRFGSHGSLWRGANAKYKKYAITSWQVWNEPNLPVYWLPKPNPKAYVNLVKATSKAVKRADKKAQIIGAGIPDSSQSKPRNYKQYLSAFLKDGGWRYVDAVGVHAYSPTAKGVGKILKTYRGLLDKNHGKKLKMMILEIGWADAGVRNKFVVGRKGQAKLITSVYKLVGQLRGSLKISGIAYFGWTDFTPPVGDPRGNTWGYHTGLFTATGKAKPAYRAWVTAVKRLMH